jgi:hypothetical protein
MRFWLACLVAIAANGQKPAPLLEKVKARAQENLKRLPNYTCTENIERSLHGRRERRLRHWDTIRLNVAYVGGKELFGLPGAGPIDRSDVDQMARGTIGNGQFAIFVRSIFVENRATFGSAGKTELDGKPAFRFDYTVPLGRSGFLVESPPFGKAIVGYSGHFWVARESLDLLRLEVSADQLPRWLKVVSDVVITDYRRISIGGSVFLLPVRSTSEARDTRGGETQNVTTFENCREFVGESVLKFEENPPSPSHK